MDILRFSVLSIIFTVPLGNHWNRALRKIQVNNIITFRKQLSNILSTDD